MSGNEWTIGEWTRRKKKKKIQAVCNYGTIYLKCITATLVINIQLLEKVDIIEK